MTVVFEDVADDTEYENDDDDDDDIYDDDDDGRKRLNKEVNRVKEK